MSAWPFPPAGSWYHPSLDASVGLEEQQPMAAVLTHIVEDILDWHNGCQELLPCLQSAKSTFHNTAHTAVGRAEYGLFQHQGSTTRGEQLPS